MEKERVKIKFTYRRVKGRDRWPADLRWSDPETGAELGRVRPNSFRSEVEVQHWGIEAQAALVAGKPLPPTPSRGKESPPVALLVALA